MLGISDQKAESLISENIGYINYVLFKSYITNQEEREDLKQELTIKLIECYKKFDKNKNVQFSTYLVKALTNTMIRFKDNNNKEKTAKQEYMDKKRHEEKNNKSHNIYDLKEVIKKSPLSTVEKNVLKMRSEGYTFKEIGEKFNVSGQRIDVIEKNAIIKMKNYAKTQSLHWCIYT